MNLLISDNFLSASEAADVYTEIKMYAYTYGEADTVGGPPTGMVHNFHPDSYLLKQLLERLYKVFPKLVGHLPFRSYINYFTAGENPYFHTDGDQGITVLIYAIPETSLDEGGETQFLEDNHCIYSVLPRPGRAVVFDARVVHKATSFRTQPRFTIALKFNSVLW